MSIGPTVVMYSPDTIGLGHTRRNSAIASELVKCMPGVSVVLMVGSSVGTVFELPSGVDSIKLPSVLKTGANDWRARSLGISNQTTLRIRSGLIRETIDALRPDLLLVDHLPSGIWGELVSTFDLIRSRRLATRIVLGLRDILDEPDRVRRRWSEEGVYDAIARYYDSVFIYGEQRIFDTAAAYGISAGLCDDVRYLGYVRGTSGRPARGEATAGGAEPRARHIVVTAGGGYDALPMMEATIAGFNQLAPDAAARMTVVTGPLMPQEHAARLEAEAAGRPIDIIRFTNRMPALLESADLVVTMGGYNSMLEIAALGKPTINIPRTGPSREQTIRAGLFEKMGLMSHLPLEAATPGRVAAAMTAGLVQPPRYIPTIEATGARRAARHIRRLIESGKSRRTHAPAARTDAIALNAAE